jgi:hypothetical protein
VIYNGIDSAQFAGAPDPVGVREEFGVPSGSALCIHVGRMDAAKNHTRLLQIFERVLRLQGDCYLILAGGGERGREQIARNEAAALGIAERVVFAGTRRDVPRLLGAADLMIFPSAWEGLPGAILEASATGTPVLASDLPCILEISERLTDVRCLSLSQADEVWAAAAVGMIAQGGAAGASERFELSQFSMSNCARAFEAMYGNSGPHSFEGAQPVTTLGLQNSFPAPGHGARMPSLDGLRAVAILLVLLGHLSGTRLFPGWLYHSTIFANLGVRIFFVLSGFLITTLLLDELRSRGQISLKRFYFLHPGSGPLVGGRIMARWAPGTSPYRNIRQ